MNKNTRDNIKLDPKLAKALRKRSTDAEKEIWLILRAKNLMRIKFRRQQPIGPYIVDFVSFDKKLLIEIDGGQHALEKEKDLERDLYFEEKGYKVLRFWNNEVLQNIDGVVEAIRMELLKNTPSP